MAVSERARRSLQEFGLTEYEMRAYLTMIEKGAMTASQISEAGNVPYSKIYEVLGELEKKGWIETQRRSRPSKYQARPPSDAIEATRLRFEENLRQNSLQVVNELQPVYEKRETQEKPDIWILRGESSIFAKVRETLNNSRKELLIALPVLPEEIIEMFGPTLVHLKEQGLRIMVMTSRRVSRGTLKKLKQNVELRLRDQMFGGGIVSDEREVILLLGDEKEETVGLAIWSDHVGLARFARNYYEYLWRESKDLTSKQ